MCLAFVGDAAHTYEEVAKFDDFLTDTNCINACILESQKIQ